MPLDKQCILDFEFFSLNSLKVFSVNKFKKDKNSHFINIGKFGKILDLIKLKHFLQTFNENSKILFADVNSKENLKTEDLKNVKSYCILIGPEGDFSPAERDLILQNRAVKPFTLSRNILRSDTAVISAISLVNFINNFH